MTTDRQDRFEVGMTDAQGMTQQQTHMMYEIAQDIDREIYEGNMSRIGAVAVLRKLLELLEDGRRRNVK